MGLPMPIYRLTVEEYLESEKDSSVRHEYLNGELYAMSGASRRHNLISLNLVSRLRSHLRGRPCQVFISDVKVRIEALNYFYYPDVVVTCEGGDDDAYFVVAPCLVAEVLSPRTAGTDQREKLRAYRQLPSLREYLLIEQDEIKVTLWRRDARGTWWEEELGPEDKLFLESVELNLQVVDLYEDAALGS